MRPVRDRQPGRPGSDLRLSGERPTRSTGSGMSFTVHSRGFPSTFDRTHQDVGMNSNRVRPTPQRGRPPTLPLGYVFRRLTSLAVVAGVTAGFIGAALVESAGLPDAFVVGAGTVAFIAATSLVFGLADGRLMPSQRKRSTPSEISGRTQ